MEQPTLDEGEGDEAVVVPAVAMDDEADGESGEEGTVESNDDDESDDDDGPAPMPEHLQMLQRLLARQRIGSQEALASSLRAEGRSEAACAAVSAVDRALFAPGCSNVYHDNPLRGGDVPHLHLSAPSIYAHSFDAFDLRPGLSFLNIGSGTGYMSALVAQAIGPTAVHHGIEMREELVAHARATCAQLGLPLIKFIHGNAFDVSVAQSMRYDRIYVGAGAPDALKAIAFKLLKWGGIIVGPFVYEGQESLIKATMRSERSFAVERLLPVAFAPLVSDGARPDTLVLRGPEWGVDSWRLFPPRFLGVAALLTWVAALPTPDDGEAPPPPAMKLPRELWTLVLAQVPFDAFEEEVVGVPCAACASPRALQRCGACKLVVYCSRECQAKHWKSHREACAQFRRAKAPVPVFPS